MLSADAATAYQDFENGDLQDAQSLVSSGGLFTNDYKEFLLPEAIDDNIDVYYEAPTGQLALGQTDVQGGLVVLYGDMLNTGTGNINVLDGYGAINVVNNTSYPLVTSGLSTGAGTAGMLKITDTGKETPPASRWSPSTTARMGRSTPTAITPTPTARWLSVLWSPTQYSGPNAGARTASYQPATARFVWEDGQDLSVTVTDNYQRPPGSESSIWARATWSARRTTAGTPMPLLDWRVDRERSDRLELPERHPGHRHRLRRLRVLFRADQDRHSATDTPVLDTQHDLVRRDDVLHDRRHHHAREEHQHQQHSCRPADQHHVHRLRRRRLHSRSSR